MSQLKQLKQQIDGLASSATKTGSSLQQFSSNFSQQIGAVSATIGGSAQSKDQAVIASLQAASKQVQAAVTALQQAAQTARNYGASL